MDKKKKTIKFRKQKFSATEFDESLLPSNRFAQFFDVLKIEWGTLLKIGFIILLFALPLVLLVFGKPTITSIVIGGLKNSGSSETAINQMNNLLNTIYYFLCCLSFMLLSIGFAGVSKIYKNICYAEGVLFKNDFFDGIKENGPRFIVFTLIGSIAFFFVYFNSSFLGYSNNFIFGMIVYLGFFAFYIFILPTILFAMANNVIYQMTFSESFFNGFKQTISKMLFTLIFSAVIYGFTFITKINHPAFLALALILGIVLLFPLFYLAWHLYSLYIFDLFINDGNYPEIYRKGLRPLITKEKGN